MEEKTKEEFEKALEGYIAEMQEKHTAYDKEHYPKLHEMCNGQYRTLAASWGKKYVKILMCDYNQTAKRPETTGSVHCFIDIATGDILKAASWNLPQKNGKRGNIYNEVRPIFGKDFYVRY